MPFASYADISEVARAHQIRLQRSAFITPQASSLSDYFRSELALTLSEVAYDGSEYAACETLIYPLLREIWKSYRQTLTLWSHPSLTFDADLCGAPDYIVARRSPLGPIVFDAPYFLVVEAKKDDFVRGWGQCLAAMLAAQKLNSLPGQTLYGVSTNGLAWQFGRLEKNVFTQEPEPFTLQAPDTLAAALHYVFSRCQDEASRHPHAA